MADEHCLLDPQRDCYGLIKADQVERDLQKLEKDVNELRRQNSSSHERIFGQIQILDKLNAIQTEQFKSIMDKLEGMGKSLTDLGNRIGTVEAKPAKRWDNLAGQIIGLAVAALMGLLFTKIGL